MKRVLITGGAGFIGSHLADALEIQNARVWTLDNLLTGKRQTPNTVVGSVTDGVLIEKIFENFKPHVVVHCAATYADPSAWFTDVGTNVIGTINVLRGCEKFGVKKIIYLQTSLCYGLNPQSPIKTGHPIDPRGSYAISKTAGERYIMEGSTPWVSLRLANVYGPRNLSGPVPTFYKRLNEKQPCFVVNTKRDFIYISDLIRVLMKVIGNKDAQGVYHVASGFDRPIMDVYYTVARAMELEDIPEPELRERGKDDAATILLDATRTREDFDWEPQVALEEGIPNAVTWYNENTVQETYTHLELKGENDE